MARKHQISAKPNSVTAVAPIMPEPFSVPTQIHSGRCYQQSYQLLPATSKAFMAQEQLKLQHCALWCYNKSFPLLKFPSRSATNCTLQGNWTLWRSTVSMPSIPTPTSFPAPKGALLQGQVSWGPAAGQAATRNKTAFHLFILEPCGG